VVWLVRHGESVGNVADAHAQRSGAGRLELDIRDPDVPLSDTGRAQAEALGHHLAGLPEDERPTAVLSSPFARALTTAQLATAGLGVRVRTDERLREREFGVLDLLTRQGIEARFPAEAERRRRLGKFYHRPPGGESWVDVALRVRSMRDSLAREHLEDRVMIVAHEVVILIWRYLIEELSEAETLRLNRTQPLANCSLTRYVTDGDQRLALEIAGWTAAIEREGVVVTEEHDAAVAPR
jgi:broad specificity phosphatase PhoE